MNKKSNSLRVMQNKEFLHTKNTKLGELISELDTPEEDYTMLNSSKQDASPIPPPDSLTLLLSRAHKITSKNMKKPKPKVRSQQQAAFLTGVQLQNAPEQHREVEEREVLDDQVLKLLNKKSLQDDLEQLRRQIRATNGTLRSYQQQLLATKKSVTRLAGRYNSYFNLQLPVNRPTVDISGYTVGMRSYKQLYRPAE